MIKIKQALSAYETKYVKRELPPLAGTQKVTQLDRNENNYGPSTQVKQAIIDEMPNISQYTDVAAQPLRGKIADSFGVETDQIIITNGSFELISLIASVYQNAGHTAITCVPTFDWYRVATSINGGKLIELPLTASHGFDLAGILATITAETDIIWLCNPNNPTGTYLSHAEISAFLDKVPDDILVVLDEAYIEYMTVEVADSIALIKNHENLILLRTFSKIHGLASLRVGYGISNQEIINQLFGLKVPPNMNRLSVQAATASLADKENITKIAKLNEKQRDYFYQELDKRSLNYIKSQANFIFVDFGYDVAELVNSLKNKGILVRGGAEYGYPNWLRITIGKAKENQLLFEKLDELFS
ncbi:histidinol-phosphate aminotransferase [Lactococcus hodotermopsidis]|uniref:Histidinol-phosphate aminotransferase n=1 Tax=Pseudolactococcus hodotermopsidis TaxID=2709157 RepID=A0A6A0BE48_9LACT|nr:histidinol-phosphate transaminase [Lactococcus hodotermopsidis]GFH42618.1 histidinol-phosphate aminotransferase [Lactococcus hodotermopsidis]